MSSQAQKQHDADVKEAKQHDADEKKHSEEVKNLATTDAAQAWDEAKERGRGITDRGQTQTPAPGRIVQFVLPNGDSRPLIIVRVWNESGNVSGHVFHDGPDDAHIDQHGPYKHDVKYNADGKEPSTWHWPARV